MEVLFLLVPIALGFVLATFVVFTWAVRDGQFDDLTTPAVRALLDEGLGASPVSANSAGANPAGAARDPKDKTAAQTAREAS